MASGASGTYAPIPAPLATPPRLGLLTAAVFPDVGDSRWLNGFTFRSDQCVPGGSTHNCAGPEGEAGGSFVDVSSPGVDDSFGPGIVRVVPVEVYVEDECSTMDFGTPDQDARARRAFVAAESRLIEAEFWLGTEAQSGNYPTPYLTDGTADNLGAVAGFYALAELQQWAAESFDGRAMIHATPRVVEFWYRNAEVRREGNLLLDAFDNIVVPGAGYDGTGPNGEAPVAGETEWAYVTPLVHILRESSIQILPGSTVEAVDRDVNLTTYRATRIVAAYHDGCGKAAVNINLCEPCCSPAGS